ncbi:HepT-like ribonuclease domain-containing protein [Jiella mangrovi]|uniref:HepT-like ribonuclease domain-containing protein n=1 Tax=Jiella mangrovi TaxID=2821407 RepID=UPI003CC90FD6
MSRGGGSRRGQSGCAILGESRLRTRSFQGNGTGWRGEPEDHDQAPGFARALAELELEAANGMRNRVAHGYEDAIVEIVLNAARHDVPKLRAAVEKILSDAGEDLA